MLEKILKSAPNDREATYLLAAMAVEQGDKTDDKAERALMFRKSSDAFARLMKAHKELTPYEKKYLTRSRVGEARVLASEGKVDQSFTLIKQLLGDGFDDIDAFEESKEFESVRKLPTYKTTIEEAIRPGIIEEMSTLKAFPFDFELKDTNDKTVSLADFKGKVTIVDIWGTWCPPCRQEIPHFVALYDQYKAKGLEIVGINCNETGTRDEIKKKIKTFAKETKIPYACVLNDEKTEEKVPGFQGYPTTLFLDRSGKVRMMLVGYSPKVKLELIINMLLAEAPRS